MQFIDDAEFQIAIDDDFGARITSIKWRDNEFAVPFRGPVSKSGWYAMAPWAGRINEGLIKDAAGREIQLPTTIDPPHAIHGYGLTSSWQEIGPGRSLLHLPAPYNGATVEQSIEVLDDAVRSPVGSPSLPRTNISTASNSISALPPRSRSRANQG